MENKEFTKKDLKNKMVVELKDGDRFVVIDDILLNDCSFDYLSYYNDDFTFDSEKFETAINKVEPVDEVS